MEPSSFFEAYAMIQSAGNLLTLLNPPQNPWLKGLARRRHKLPDGVRIVRFGSNDSDDEANDMPALAVAKPRCTGATRLHRE